MTALDRNGTRELAETIVGQPPPAALVDWVDQRARGNPLYVISLVRALLEEHADLSAPGCSAPRSAARRASSSTRSGRLAGAAIAVRCSAPVSLDGLRDQVAAGLDEAGLARPQVTVEIVDRFERPGGPRAQAVRPARLGPRAAERWPSLTTGERLGLWIVT